MKKFIKRIAAGEGSELPLSLLPTGKHAKITCIDTSDSLRNRFYDFGIMEHTAVRALYRSPLGDPTAYHIRGAVVAIRADDAAKITVNLK